MDIDEEPPTHLVIQATSGGFDAGNFAKITINDVDVEMPNNEHDHQRGLHIVVINPDDGEIMQKKVFDTYKTSTKFDEFIKEKSIQDGHIVVVACKDDCASSLSWDSYEWFADMGSKEIEDV